jgi:hypothetical protein
VVEHHSIKHQVLKTKTTQTNKVTTVILATWEVEIRRIVVQDQPGQKVHKTTISTNDWVQ